MKYSIIIIGLAMFILTMPAHMAYGQDTYYYGLGQQPLWKCDSIITIKFDPAYPHLDYVLFAQSIAALDETREPRHYYGAFDIYWIEEGYNTDSLVTELAARPDIEFVFRAYIDSAGQVLMQNHQIVIKYKESALQTSRDSLEAANNLLVSQNSNDAIGRVAHPSGWDFWASSSQFPEGTK